eukprot:SAG31_NODE_35836_length_319_cov_0.927273_1_plen_59_part_01
MMLSTWLLLRPLVVLFVASTATLAAPHSRQLHLSAASDGSRPENHLPVMEGGPGWGPLW